MRYIMFSSVVLDRPLINTPLPPIPPPFFFSLPHSVILTSTPRVLNNCLPYPSQTFMILIFMRGHPLMYDRFAQENVGKMPTVQEKMPINHIKGNLILKRLGKLLKLRKFLFWRRNAKYLRAVRNFLRCCTSEQYWHLETLLYQCSVDSSVQFTHTTSTLKSLQKQSNPTIINT